MDMTEERGFVIEAANDGGYRLRRVPDGLTLRARSWDEVSAACPEFGVPWRAVSIDPACEQHVLATWGPRPAP